MTPVRAFSHIDLLGGAVLALGLGLAGGALAEAAGLALPGAVIGLVGLAALMALAPPAAASGASALFDRVSPHMILLFVPAGSGVVSRAPDLAADWPAVGLAVLIGTPAVIAIVAVAAQALFAGNAQRGEVTR